MIIKKHFSSITFALLILFLTGQISPAQTNKFPNPRQETLLNGLKMLVWYAPDAEKVSVKLRIHRGSAFDRQDKEGTMALLSAILLPGQPSRDFFNEDLGGSLEIINTYDYIQINATAGDDQILLLLQTLATAVASPLIDKETTDLVRAEMLEKVSEMEKDPAYIADRAIARRLFGDFPYGRPVYGTVETLKNTDFADLIFAKERFLTPDNATLTISGKVKSDLMYRAIRRYFGIWTKANEKVPANFRIPDPPSEEELRIEFPGGENIIEDRYALEGVARNDKNFYSAKLLEHVLNSRFQEISKQNGLLKAGVRFQPHFLNGTFVFSKKLDQFELPQIFPLSEAPSAEQPVGKKEHFLIKMIKQKITRTEFEEAKKAVVKEFQTPLNDIDNLSDFWLDKDTFKLDSIADELKKLNQVSITDVQQTADNLQNSRIASISVVPA